MNLIVCVKRVPETAEAEITIDKSGRGIQTDDLVFDINEWDNYAVEEAVRIKETHGGKITVVTLGPQESQDTLRRALAMGADEALHLNDPSLLGGDPYATAKALHAALKDKPFDLIFAGVQAGDDGYGQVGPILAEFYQIPHATMVTKVEVNGEKARIHRELEGGLEEVCEITLPALLTIQTGINEPRYVSIMGIRKAKQKEIRELTLQELTLAPGEVGSSGSLIELKEIYLPPVGKAAEMLKGNIEELSGKVVTILKEKGGLGS
ncbi:MAG: electron transfer flavoprotein subunit beta/FixA family protein [Pseudomonadota bacterium]